MGPRGATRALHLRHVRDRFRQAGQDLFPLWRHPRGLSLVGDLCNGLLYLVSRAAGLGADSAQITTADWGSRFIVVAGLLNVIAAVDTHNLRTGRKAS